MKSKNLLLNFRRISLIMIFAAVSVFAYGQDDDARYHFKYGFEGDLPVGWTERGRVWFGSDNVNADWDGHYGSEAPAKIDSDEWMMTNQYFTAGTLTFWLMLDEAGFAGDGTIKKGVVNTAGDDTTWTTIWETQADAYPETSPDGGSDYYKQHSIEINSNEAGIIFLFDVDPEASRSFYYDDMALTMMEPSADDANILNLNLGGVSFTDFRADKTEYENVDVVYPTVDFGIETFHPDASAEVTNPTDFYGNAEERTATIEVTSSDESNSKAYEFIMNVDSIHTIQDFESGTNVKGWFEDGAYNDDDEGYMGGSAPRMTRETGVIRSPFVKGIGTLSFYTKHDPGNDALESLIVNKLVVDGTDTIQTELKEYITGADITSEWAHYEVEVNDNSDQVAILFTYSYANEETRIYLDDIVVEGHEDFLDPAYWEDDDGTGINTIADASDMTLSPNPASNFVNIDLPEAIEGKVIIRNLLGKKVTEIEVNDSEFAVNISGLQNGMYILTVTDGVKAFTGKFIKE